MVGRGRGDSHLLKIWQGETLPTELRSLPKFGQIPPLAVEQVLPLLDCTMSCVCVVKRENPKGGGNVTCYGDAAR